jgi:phenylpropionate dioxygenase-like ring-hydroxylating dioxygenase large terminal subunit
MLTKELNDRLTQTGPGTPGGTLLRYYWQPVALSEELPPNAPPKPVRILSEDLVLFRDDRGKPALLGIHCAHRGCDLSYGRLEDGGLRCIYHGWLFAGDGRCLEQPGESQESTYKDRIRQLSYPCFEKNGLVIAYMGPGEPPPIPQWPFLVAPSENVWCTKLWTECNYLQGNEGNVDPQHLSFLHRMSDAQGLFRDSRVVMGGDVAPRLLVEDAAFGLRTYAWRTASSDEIYVRISNFVMPNGSTFDGSPVADPKKVKPGANDGYQAHWHVPVDDSHHYKYVIVQRYEGAIDRAYLERDVTGQIDEKYARPPSKANRYLQDRKSMDVLYAGIGRNFQDQDRFAVESEGPIFDRSGEHLGTTDVGVIGMRKQMLKAIEDIEAGREPLGIDRSGQTNPAAELVVRSMRLPKDAEISGFWREKVSA